MRRLNHWNFMENEMKPEKLQELVLQSLEHEKGGVQIYETALKCAVNEDLKEEWQEYLDQTRNHVRVVTELCAALGVDAAQETPGRAIVRSIGAALVSAMEQALAAGAPDAAQIVACECVVLAETKDHLDWALLGQYAKKAEDAHAAPLEACAGRSGGRGRRASLPQQGLVPRAMD